MFIVLLNMILSSLALIIIVGTALLLTVIAVTLIIVSAVRSSKAKKEHRKTSKAGMWAGIIMLILPWLFAAMAIAIVKVTDKLDNRWTFDKQEVAEAIADKDEDALFDLMAPAVIDGNDLTEDDLEDFLDQFDIDNSSSDMERYTAYENLGSASDPTGNHYRPDGQYFTYTMYYVTEDGDRIFVEGALYDREDPDGAGIWYIEYLTRDPETGDYNETASFGERADK